MSGILRSTEQDDTSSCGSLSPLWSSNEDNIVTVGDECAEESELVQVPEEEPNVELDMFLNQADRPGWDDHLFSTQDVY